MNMAITPTPMTALLLLIWCIIVPGIGGLLWFLVIAAKYLIGWQQRYGMVELNKHLAQRREGGKQ